MKLTEHFDLSEFTRSATADRLHIDNSIDSSVPSGQSVVNNLKNLCEQVLEPLREHFGNPVVVSSGYRCPTLNKAVGGVPNSQHQKGEAADIVVPNSKKLSTGFWIIAILINLATNKTVPPNGFTSVVNLTFPKTAKASFR